MSTGPWTLELALPIIRQVETIAAECGFHTALTGSVLFRGESNEDLDIIFYPRKTERRKDFVALVDELRSHGFNKWELRDHTLVFDKKVVYSTVYVCNDNIERRVDFFILM